MVFGFDVPGTGIDHYLHAEQHVLVEHRQSISLHPLLKKPAVAIRLAPPEATNNASSDERTETARTKEVVLYFDRQSAEVRADERFKLDLFTQGDRVTLIGMASPEGSADQNRALSRRRAKAAEAMLLRRGVVIDRIVSTGAERCNEEEESAWKCRRVCVSEKGICDGESK